MDRTGRSQGGAAEPVAAVIVAGGGATRLGGVPKETLIGPDGRTLLRCVVDACRPAEPIVVVGARAEAALPGVTGVSFTCEEPAGAGPARALQAGVEAVGRDVRWDEARWVLVLAGDLPAAGPAVRALRAAAGGLSAEAADGVVAGESVARGHDGLVAVAGGRRQWLLGLYRFEALARAVALPPWRPGQRGEAVRDLLGRLVLGEVAVPEDAGADLDTWADVTRAGFRQSGQAAGADGTGRPETA